MNTHEDTLKTALAQTAAEITADRLPPLRLPAGPARGPGRRRPQRGGPAARYTRPALAAASVAAVAVATLAVTASLGGAPRSAGGGPPAAQPAQVSLPPVAVALVAPVHGPGAGLLKHLEVRATATGKTLASIRPPRPANSFCDITGSAHYGSFVAVACDVKTTLDGKTTVTMTPTGYIAFQVSRSGRVTGQRALAIGVPHGRMSLESLALSPDGSKLAVAAADLTGTWARNPAIELFSTATGRLLHRWTWRGTADIADRSYSGGLLSWTADGSTLAFPLATSHRSVVQTRLLDTTAAGRSLAASRVAVTFRHVPVQVSVVGTLGNADAMITPDGSAIVSGTDGAAGGQGATTGLAITEVPSGLGPDHEPARTLDPVQAAGPYVLYREVLWSNADGSVLIATGFPGSSVRLDGNAVIGVVTRGGFRPLPGSMAGVFQIAF